MLHLSVLFPSSILTEIFPTSNRFPMDQIYLPLSASFSACFLTAMWSLFILPHSVKGVRSDSGCGCVYPLCCWCQLRLCNLGSTVVPHAWNQDPFLVYPPPGIVRISACFFSVSLCCHSGSIRAFSCKVQSTTCALLSLCGSGTLLTLGHEAGD